jgi:hypothetical protein
VSLVPFCLGTISVVTVKRLSAADSRPARIPHDSMPLLKEGGSRRGVESKRARAERQRGWKRAKKSWLVVDQAQDNQCKRQTGRAKDTAADSTPNQCKRQTGRAKDTAADSTPARGGDKDTHIVQSTYTRSLLAAKLIRRTGACWQLHSAGSRSSGQR